MVPPLATKTATMMTRVHMDIAKYIIVNIAYSLSLISSRPDKLRKILWQDEWGNEENWEYHKQFECSKDKSLWFLGKSCFAQHLYDGIKGTSQGKTYDNRKLCQDWVSINSSRCYNYDVDSVVHEEDKYDRHMSPLSREYWNAHYLYDNVHLDKASFAGRYNMEVEVNFMMTVPYTIQARLMTL